MKVSEAALMALSRRLESEPPTTILRFALEAFGPRLAVLSSMQRADNVLTHMVGALTTDGRTDVLFVDTGVLHQETLATRDRVAAASPRLNVRTLRPADSFDAQVRARGVLYLTKEGQELCCDLRKSKPLEAERGRYDVLVSALRRADGGRRGEIPVVAYDAATGALRLHPIVMTSEDDLAAYEAAHEVVRHPLHAWGYPTIGCHPCTTPVREDEPLRAGRWRHLADVTYCGINPTDRADAASARQGVDVGDGTRRLFELAGVAL